MKIACPVHACLNCAKYFRKAEKAWKLMIAQAVHAQLLAMTTLKKCEMWFERPKVGCSSNSWGSQFGEGKCWRILREELNMRKVCAKMVPKLLSDEQKERPKKLRLDFGTHWEWTRFVEFDNYLWWNLGICLWSGDQATVNAVELNIISKTKKSTLESLEVQGHVDCFISYPGYCNGRVDTQQPDGKSAVLHWSLEEIAWRCEKETTGIMEKRVTFAPGQRPSPQRIVCTEIFS